MTSPHGIPRRPDLRALGSALAEGNSEGLGDAELTETADAVLRVAERLPKHLPVLVRCANEPSRFSKRRDTC